MSDSIKYTVYPAPQKQRASLLLLIAGVLILTGITAFIYLKRTTPPASELKVPPVAPLVPNPAPVPNPH